MKKKHNVISKKNNVFGAYSKKQFKKEMSKLKQNRCASIYIPEKELMELSQKELLTLTRALINVRDGRSVSFSISTVTPKVIACAEKVEGLPKHCQDKEIARINKFAFDHI